MNPAHSRAGFKLTLCVCQPKLDSALKFRFYRPVTFFAARYRARFGTSGLRIFHIPCRARPSKMTSEDIEVLVRAMTVTADNLDTGPVKHLMQEATTQVIAHVVAARGFCRDKI
jgi:hypothetical protein